MLGFGAVIVFGILGYYRDDKWLYLISGVGSFVWGCTYIATNEAMGVIVAALGIYTFIRGLFTKRAS